MTGLGAQTENVVAGGNLKGYVLECLNLWRDTGWDLALGFGQVPLLEPLPWAEIEAIRSPLIGTPAAQGSRPCPGACPGQAVVRRPTGPRWPHLAGGHAVCPTHFPSPDPELSPPRVLHVLWQLDAQGHIPVPVSCLCPKPGLGPTTNNQTTDPAPARGLATTSGRGLAWPCVSSGVFL